MKRTQIRSKLVTVIIILVAVIAALSVGVLMRDGHDGFGLDNPTAASAESLPEASVSAQTEAAAQTEPLKMLEMPVALENGRLRIESIFPYSGMNPDDENQEVQNVAAITLLNCSGEYLKEARIALILDNGVQANFVITDLPAGRRAVAFCVDSAEIHEHTECMDVSCEAAFDSDASMKPDQVAVSVDGMSIALTNLTDKEIREMVVYCRCPLSEDFFGGITYQYTVNNLPANSSTTVDAWDCVLGMTEVVRIDIKE